MKRSRRHRYSRVEAKHQRVVFSVSEGEFLAIEIADDRIRLHDDSRFVVIHARGEGASQGDRTPIFKFGCILAEIPNVALLVLRIPIEGIFRQHAIEINYIVDLSAGDAHDHFGFVGDDEIVVNKAILTLPFVKKGLTRWQRKE